MIRSRFLRCVLAGVLGALLTACGQATTAPDAAPAADGTPVEVNQCGQPTRLLTPATRAVTLNQHATELVLAMGLGDRLIGTSLLDSAVRPDLKVAYDAVPVLSESAYPAKEALLGMGPDLLVGGFGPTFSEANGLPPDQFQTAGIGLFTVQCRGEVLTTDITLDTIAKLGVLFAAPDQATALSDQLTAQFAAVRAQVQGRAPVDVMIFDSGEAAATVVSRRGMEHALTELAGGRNVFADLDRQYAEVGWEEVVRRDPAVIVVLDYSPELADTATPKIASIKANPALAGVRAVRDNRFVVLPLTGMGAVSPRNGEVAQQLADVLHPRS